MDMSAVLDMLIDKRVKYTQCCDSSGYMHIACFFKRNGKKMNVVSIGANKKMVQDKLPNIHAELDAICKLKDNKSKKMETVNLLVIRTSMNGILGNSKPCIHCLISLGMIAPRKGYKIEKVYYSDPNGEIIKKNLNELMEDEAHLSRYFKERNFKIK